jgi:hypothetical protein
MKVQVSIEETELELRCLLCWICKYYLRMWAYKLCLDDPWATSSLRPLVHEIVSLLQFTTGLFIN